MNKRSCLFLAMLLVLSFAGGSLAQADEWRFAAGYTYASGFSDVVDLFKEDVNNSGYVVTDVSYQPLGLSASPYYQFDSGFGIGGSVGPLAIISADPYFFMDIPLGIDGRYTFNLSGAASPYVRAGVRQHAAQGDFVESSTPGLFGAVGLEFLKEKGRRICGGVEIAYDGATIEMEKVRTHGTESVTPGGMMLSLFVVF